MPGPAEGSTACADRSAGGLNRADANRAVGPGRSGQQKRIAAIVINAG